MASDVTCDTIDDRMTDLLDGTATDDLLDHVADCDRCRDARHDAERARDVAAAAADDWRPGEGFDARLEAAVSEAAGHAAPDAPAPAPTAPVTERIPVEPGRALPAGAREQASSGAAPRDETTETSRTAPARTDDGETRGAVAQARQPVRTATRGGDPRATPNDAPTASIPAARRTRPLVVGGLALAAAAAAVFVLSTGKDGKSTVSAAPWTGKVTHVSNASGGPGGLEKCDASWNGCAPLGAGDEIPAGSRVRTSAHASAALSMADGTTVALDRSSRLVMRDDADRTCSLLSGSLVAEVVKSDGKTARFDVPGGTAEVLGTKLGLRVNEKAATVDVSRGSVRLADSEGRAVTVRAGEEGRLFEGIPPYVTAAPSLGEALAWSDRAFGESDGETTAARGLGELKAKKPGAKQELGAGAVTLASHAVKVRIVGNVARTEVDETFTNTTDDVLEGIYRFPLPPDAQIERLALEVDGKLEEGAFLDRERAAAIWRGAIVNAAPQIRQQIREEIVWVPGPWKDPALLEWQRGGRFELRIYPIPKKGARRVVLAYTQVIPPAGGLRRYTYPLPHDPSGSTRVAKFDVDIQLKGHDPDVGVRSSGYELNRQPGPEAHRMTMDATEFVPSGDLFVEYALPNRDAELSAWAYEPSADDVSALRAKRGAHEAKVKTAGGAPAVVTDRVARPADDESAYVAFAVRPKLPPRAEDVRRSYAIVVDASRSMFGERLKRAADLTARIVSEMDRGDVFAVLACDTTCRTMEGGAREPSAQASAEARSFLTGLAPEGGSDVSAAVLEGLRATTGSTERVGRVVYVGDGTPTVGAIHPAFVEREIAAELGISSATVTAVAVGADSDLATLRAVARGGGGVILPYVPGQRVSETAYSVLAATYGNTLAGARIELPDGFTDVAPAVLPTIPAGGEVIVTARMTRPVVESSVRLTGTVAGQAFEQRYPVTVSATRAKGNAFVPRLFAAAHIEELERTPGPEAKERAVTLSTSFDVASRYTSLLVLESKAMFEAFGLDQRRGSPVWTGEDEAAATVADGELDVGAEDVPGADAQLDVLNPYGSTTAGAGALGLSGIGSGGSARGAAAGPMPAKKSADLAEPKSEAAPGRFAQAPAAASPPPPPASRPRQPRDDGFAWEREKERPVEEPPRWNRGRRMIPMRRTFERVGVIAAGGTVPKAASATSIAAAESKRADNPESRNALMEVLRLYMLAGDLERGSVLAEQWSAKDPLDPEALTARADLASRSGDRELAIRILGSVLDVRPDDFKSQQRLARLHRWAGNERLGCRFAMGIAQFRTKDGALLAEAVRCLRRTGNTRTADALLETAEVSTRTAAERLLSGPDPIATEALSGDLRLEATWDGGADLDLALIHPEGHRVSWLGAPTRSVITARDVVSTTTEGLSLRGAKPGEYAIEVVRASGTEGQVRGSLKVTAAGTTQSIPFVLDGSRLMLGTVRITMQERLVPL